MANSQKSVGIELRPQGSPERPAQLPLAPLPRVAEVVASHSPRQTSNARRTKGTH